MRRNCTRCNGTGQSAPAFKAGDTLHGTNEPVPVSWTQAKPCYSCKGIGQFPPIDEEAIRSAIVAQRGRNKGRLLSSRPDRKHGPRAYYVWRLARFHGGRDVTMPVFATLDIGGDPFATELDALADSVAKENFGTDLAAAHQWGRALGYIS